MRVLALSLLALLFTSCQRWNPELCSDDHPCAPGRYCAAPDEDGRRRCRDREDMATACSQSQSCPDPQPLCEPATASCRACAAGEDRLCAERDPARPRCVAPRCAECLPGVQALESADCAKGTPVCDAQRASCRPCLRHSECASGVCIKDDHGAAIGLQKGACVPAEQVLVLDQSICNDLGPVFCTPSVAISRLDRDHRYLIFRRTAKNMEMLLSDLDLGLNESQRGFELTLIGPLADGPPDQLTEEPTARIGGFTMRRGFVVWPRTRVTLEGFVISSAQAGVDCVGDTNTPTEVRILRSLIGGNRVGVALKNNCHGEIVESWLGRRPPKGAWKGVAGNAVAIEILGSDLDLVSSAVAENGDGDAFSGVRILGLGARALSTIVNTTFYGQGGRGDGGGGRYVSDLLCEGAALDRLVILNSLFLHGAAARFPGDGHLSAGCGAQYHAIGSGDATLTQNGSVVVPTPPGAGFRDAAALDLRLDRGQTAAAQQALQGGGLPRVMVRGATISAPATDLDGRPRPVVSGRVAIGAYEPVP